MPQAKPKHPTLSPTTQVGGWVVDGPPTPDDRGVPHYPAVCRFCGGASPFRLSVNLMRLRANGCLACRIQASPSCLRRFFPNPPPAGPSPRRFRKGQIVGFLEFLNDGVRRAGTDQLSYLGRFPACGHRGMWQARAASVNARRGCPACRRQKAKERRTLDEPPQEV